MSVILSLLHSGINYTEEETEIKLKSTIFLTSVANFEYSAVRVFVRFSFFYRAYLSLARLCHSKLSVRPSVTLVNCDHMRWNSSKTFSRMISLTFPLSADPNITDLLQTTPQILAGIIGKNVDF